MAPTSLEFSFWIGIKKSFFHSIKHNCSSVNVRGEDRVISTYSTGSGERVPGKWTYDVDRIDVFSTLVS